VLSEDVYGDQDKRKYIRGNSADVQQRQTVVSQFFQLDRLVVEGGKTVGSPTS
jgi:hypothetical protein